MTILSFEEFSKHFGAELHEMRKARGWTLEDLRNRMGLSASYLNAVELGKNMPSLNVLLDYATVFEVSLSLLMRSVEASCVAAKYKQKMIEEFQQNKFEEPGKPEEPTKIWDENPSVFLEDRDHG